MTPLEHLRVWLGRCADYDDGKIALSSCGEENLSQRTGFTMGEVRAIEALASAHDGEKAAMNLDDFTALSKQVEGLKRELDETRQTLRRCNEEHIKEMARADAFFDALKLCVGLKP